MPYLDKYKSFLEEMPYSLDEMKKAGHYTAFGYTSDLDYLIKWDVERFNQLLADNLIGEPNAEEGNNVNDMQSFARTVSYYVINGYGGEINITDISVCEYLEKHFTMYSALGGTCAQGAAALGAMGVPLVAHITDRCRPVCEFMKYPELSLFAYGKPLPAAQAASEEPPVIHMILQYNKGDVVRFQGKEFTIPLSNRLIMDYDQIHKYLPIDPDFLTYCENNAKKLYSYNVSGFNAITDLQILKERMTELKEHYKKVKMNNPDCVLYLEGAHYLNAESEDFVFYALSEYLDILGMNEEELVALCKRFELKVNKDNLESVLEGLALVIKKYPVKGIVMHTKDYSMYYGTKLETVNIEKGLTMGNLMSGTKARIGRYGRFEDLAESLSLPLSPVGVLFAQQLDSLIINHYVCIVPSRYMEHPIDTIGLGDTFVAGMQLGFMQ